MSWLALKVNDDDVHVLPVEDLVEHDENKGECVCIPNIGTVTRRDGSIGFLYTHHSLDGRELHE